MQSYKPESFGNAAAIPTDWIDPPRPGNKPCACGEILEPKYLPPTFWKGRPVFNTGTWDFPSRCKACQEVVDAKNVEQEKIDAEQRRQDKIIGLIQEAGFHPIHLKMRLSQWKNTGGEKAASAIEAFKNGDKGLFVYGSTGTGKTHLATGLVRSFIIDHVRPGKFRVMPELMNLLRQESLDASGILSEILDAGAVGLDDFGVGRINEFALEYLYLIIDGFYCNEFKRLVITSNLTLDQIASRVDDRIASRIAAMCEVVKLDGGDRRISV